MELGLILGRNLEKPGKQQNLGVFQGFSRSNFAFLPFSRFFQVFPGFPGHLATLMMLVLLKFKTTSTSTTFKTCLLNISFTQLINRRMKMKKVLHSNQNTGQMKIKKLFDIYMKIDCILIRLEQ